MHIRARARLQNWETFSEIRAIKALDCERWTFVSSHKPHTPACVLSSDKGDEVDGVAGGCAARMNILPVIGEKAQD